MHLVGKKGTVGTVRGADPAPQLSLAFHTSCPSGKTHVKLAAQVTYLPTSLQAACKM